MGQIPSKIYEASCIYDFTVNGGAVGTIPLGITLRGGEDIVVVRYTVIDPIITAAVNIDAGYAFQAGVGLIDIGHTVAVLNAALGKWLQNANWNQRRFSITNTNSMQIVLSTPNVITAGKLLFSFTVLQHPVAA